MTANAVPAQNLPPGSPSWSTGKYLSDLNKTAIYAVSRGMVPLLVTHIRFLMKFTNAWLEDEKKKRQDSAGRAAEALMGEWPRWTRWTQGPIAKWLGSRTLPNGAALLLVLLPYPSSRRWWWCS